MKQLLKNLNKKVKLPISVEEEYQFNNQMFQISDVKDNYYNIGKKILKAEKKVVLPESNKETIGEENNTEYELFVFNSENPIFSKSKFEVGDQIRVVFEETNELKEIMILLNNASYNLRTLENKKEFITASIPTKRFIILEYQKEIIEEENEIIEEVDDGNGGTIPETKTETIEKEEYFFIIKYIENLNCNLLENNYNMYYNVILSSIKDVEKKYSRNFYDTSYAFYIDSITSGDIILPMKDIRAIKKVCYLTTELDETNEGETKENQIKIIEKEIDSKYFTVEKVGDYEEYRVLKTDENFKEPEDILNDGSIESEIPYVIYFDVGFENNEFPNDLKLAFMNDIQFKLMNRGSDILVVKNRTTTSTDFCKNVFKNYKQISLS